MNLAAAFRRFTIILPVLLATCIARAAEPLQKFENRTFIPTDWADGDSFRVGFPNGQEHTIRLYGADCIEWHVNNPTDVRRLSSQRRHFGITYAAPDAAQAIAMAKSFGELAAKDTQNALVKPFTVHTAFSDARGDGKHPRIYAFVTCADGSDLATRLVENGLARASGVCRTTHDGRSAAEYRAHLADMELRAAKLGRGIWAKTDWDKLPIERHTQRDADAEVELALASPTLAPDQKLDPNNAARDDLMKLPGIGEEMADRIIEGRPYAKTDDLLEVSGIGPKTLEKLAPLLTLPAAGK